MFDQLIEPDDDFKSDHYIAPVLERLKEFIRLAIPNILCHMMLTIKETIVFVIVASLKDTTKLAAIGLGNSFMTLFAWPWVYGINTAMESLVSHAFGRGDLHSCGMHFH